MTKVEIYDPEEIRERIAECRSDLARAEGEQAALSKQISTEKESLAAILDCDPGKAKAAILALRNEIETDQAELESLIDAAEAARDGIDEGSP